MPLDFLVSYDFLKTYLRKGSIGADDRARSEVWAISTSLPRPTEAEKAKKDISVKDIFQDNSTSAASIFKSLCAEHALKLERYTHLDPNDCDERAYINDTSSLLIELLKDKTNGFQSPDFFKPLFRMVIKLIRRADISFLIASDLLLNKNNKYVEASQDGVTKCCIIFRSLLADHMPKTCEQLTNLGALKDQYLELMFSDFFVELLPEPAVLRCVDAYLLEGVKVLYRYALALIEGYKRMIKKGAYFTGEEFWVAVKTDSFNCGGVLPWKLLYIPEKLPPSGGGGSPHSPPPSGALTSNLAFHRNAELIHKHAFQSGTESMLELKKKWAGQHATTQKIKSYDGLASDCVARSRSDEK